MRIMALDVGEKTIGVAVTDEMGWSAQGITTIRRTELQKDFDELFRYLGEYNVEKLIVGLPYRGDGEVGTQARKVLALTDKLKEYLSTKGRETPIEMWDESLTTSEAHEILGQAGLSMKKRKKVIDKMAAVMILQSYLHSHS